MIAEDSHDPQVERETDEQQRQDAARDRRADELHRRATRPVDLG